MLLSVTLTPMICLMKGSMQSQVKPLLTKERPRVTRRPSLLLDRAQAQVKPLLTRERPRSAKRPSLLLARAPPLRLCSLVHKLSFEL